MEKDNYWELRISLQNSSNQEVINVDEMGHLDLNKPRVYHVFQQKKFNHHL